MIKLKAKNKRKTEEEEAKKEAEANGEVIESKTKKSPGELRLQKELTELDIPQHAQADFGSDGNIMSFHLTVSLKNEDCYWKGGVYKFSIDVPASYPHDPPKCMCKT